jgi:SAM-dependent methyltransferase
MSDIGWTEELTRLHEAAGNREHFMDTASREQALRVLERSLHTDARILEIGSSSGYMLDALRRRFPRALGSDVIHAPLVQLSHAGHAVARLDASRAPLRASSLDAIVALNVLEHIQDDHEALLAMAHALKPRGWLYIEVPANPALYDSYDRSLMHYRRYRMRDLRRMIDDAGLRVRMASHLGCFIYPGFWLVKKRQGRETQTDMSIGRGSRFMRTVMTTERWLGDYVRYPFGIRCTVAAQKP